MTKKAKYYLHFTAFFYIISVMLSEMKKDKQVANSSINVKIRSEPKRIFNC